MTITECHESIRDLVGDCTREGFYGRVYLYGYMEGRFENPVTARDSFIDMPEFIMGLQDGEGDKSFVLTDVGRIWSIGFYYELALVPKV